MNEANPIIEIGLGPALAQMQNPAPDSTTWRPAYKSR
jgi:hypothetical protein